MLLRLCPLFLKFVSDRPGKSLGVSSVLLGLVLAGRAAFVFLLSFLPNLAKKSPNEMINFKKQITIWWAGLMRGVVSIALAYNQFKSSGHNTELQRGSAIMITSTITIVLFSTMIFTNGDRAHAAKVLNRMGLEDCFEGVICFETLNPNNDVSPNDDNLQNLDILKHISESNVLNYSIELPKSPILCKPNVDAMTKALKLANIDPKRTIFFDDSIRNIQAGKEIGLQTVLVPRLHCLICRKLATQDYHPKSPVSMPLEHMVHVIQETFLEHLTTVLGNDGLAAQFVLLHLLSRLT